MWRLLEIIAAAAIVLIAITEFFYPLIAGKPIFGSFRKTKNNTTTSSTVDGSLNEKINKAKEKVEEIKNVQNEVDKNFKTAEQLKEESDNLLNKNK